MANYKTYQDTDFTAGDSPATLDFETDLGFSAGNFYIYCDGPGEIDVALSYDSGSTFGDTLTLNNGLGLSFEQEGPVDQLRITHTGTDSSYSVGAK